MRIAIAKEDDRVSGHFGHCQGFQVYEVMEKEVVSSTFLENPGHIPGFLPKYLSENQVDVIIAGGMGAKAQDLFKESNIEVVVGIQGDIEATIKAFVQGSIESNQSVCRAHEHAGNCGQH